MFTKTEKMRRPYRRRHYFINKRLQGRFTIYFLILGLFVALGTSALIWYFSSVEFDKYIYRSHMSPIRPWDVASPIMVKSVIISIIVLIISTYIVARLIFMRISSRLTTFNESLERFSSGDLKTMVPEGGIGTLNEMLDIVRQKKREKIIVLANIHKEMEVAARTAPSVEDMKKEMERLGMALKKELSDSWSN